MQINEILQALEHLTGRFPRKAVEAAIAQREAITPHLLQVLERAARDLDWLVADDDYMLHLYAFYLLAQFRETRAYPLIVAFFSHPGEAPMDVAGSFVTEDLGRVLASVSDGDMTGMKQLIENPQVNEYVRNAAMEGMLTLFVEGVVPREPLVTYFRSLFQGGLERTYSYIWTGLVVNSTMLYPEELLPDIQQAFADNFVDEWSVDYAYIEETLAEGQAATLVHLRQDHHYHFINDTVQEMEWWACFTPPSSSRSVSIPKSFKTQQPVTVPKKVGRNDPCPCGSGLKYKYCCGKPG
jgi:hypothetical protein